MIECPTYYAVPSRCSGFRHDLAEGEQINDTGSQKSIQADHDGGGGIDGMFNFETAVSIDDPRGVQLVLV